MTKRLPSVDEVASSGMVVIMRLSEGTAERLDSDTERKITDLVKR